MSSTLNPSGAWTPGQSTLVAQQVVTGAAVSSILFSGLDGLTDGGYQLELALISNAFPSEVGLCINGDTVATNYKGKQIAADTQTTANTYIPSPTNSVVGVFDTAGLLATCVIQIQIANGLVNVIAQAKSSGTSAERLSVSGFRYTPTISNLTSLLLQGYSDGTNNALPNVFGVGTIARLYRKITNGSAHTIQANGSRMAPEGVLNFGPTLKVTDDPVNGATKVDLAGNIALLSSSGSASFSATKGGVVDQTAFPSGVWTKVTCASEEWDTNSNYDGLGSRFTPTIAGKYQFNGAIRFTTSFNNLFGAAIAKNGSVVKVGMMATESGGNSATVSAVIDMNGTSDYVEMYGIQFSGGVVTLTATSPDTYFQGALVGPAVQTVQPVQLNPSNLTNLVQEIVIGTATNQVNFTNLDGTTDEGYFFEAEIVNALASAQSMRLYVNGDTTDVNYKGGSMWSAYQTNAVSSDAVACASLPTLQGAVGATLTIKGLALNNRAGNYSCVWDAQSVDSSGNPYIIHGSNRKTATISNLTSLTFSDITGLGIGVGSRFRLYRRQINPALVLTNRYLTNLVQTITTTTNTNSLMFSGLNSLIDGDYILEFSGVQGTANDVIKLYVNGDTIDVNYQNLYSQNYVDANGTQHSSQVKQSVPQIAYSVSMGTIKISIANGYINIMSISTRYDNINVLLVNDQFFTAYKIAASRITSLQVFDSTGNGIGTGTTFRLYKTNAAQQVISAGVTDISSITSDYPLKVNETVSITYTGAISVPLYTAIQEGEYEVTITGDLSNKTTSNAAVSLGINNVNTFATSYWGDYISVGAVTVTVAGSVPSGINIGNGNLYRGTYKISTFTKGKIVEYRAYVGQTSGNYSCSALYVLNDTTTPWTSLGTISFPFAQSGKIIIRRIM